MKINSCWKSRLVVFTLVLVFGHSVYAVSVTPPVKAGVPDPQTAKVSATAKTAGKVMGTITGSPGGKGVAQWFGGKCENIKINLLNESSAVASTINAVSVSVGCRFETIISSPRSFKVQAPASYDKMQFKWQYYQSWAASDINNTTNIVLKEAAPETVQSAVKPADIKLKSIRNYPWEPIEKDYNVSVFLSAENKGNMAGTQKVYYKCLPQDTPTCGIFTKSSELQSTEIHVAEGQTIEMQLFSPGSFLILLKPGKYEIIAGLNPSLADGTVVRKKFTVHAPLMITRMSAKTPMTVGENDIIKTIGFDGVGFNPHTVILMWFQGGSDYIKLPTTPHPSVKPTNLVGQLPKPIGLQTGKFYFRAQKATGEMSNSVELEVKPAYTGPPVIRDYWPRAINKWWYGQDSASAVFEIPHFEGDGVTGNKVKMTVAMVESDPPKQRPLTIGSYNSTIYMPWDGAFRKGVIEIAIYNGDNPNPAKVRIPVDKAIPNVDYPIITFPAGTVFCFKDVTFRIEPPKGVTTGKYRLKWVWRSLYGSSNDYSVRTIMDTVDVTVARQGITVPQSLFQEGSYTVEARLMETDGSPSVNAWTYPLAAFTVLTH